MTFSNRELRLKVLFASTNLDHSLVSWKLKKRESRNKFVYCNARCQEKVRKLLCSVIYFHGKFWWCTTRHVGELCTKLYTTRTTLVFPLFSFLETTKAWDCFHTWKALLSKRSHPFPNVLKMEDRRPVILYIAVVKQMPNANSQFLYIHPLSL